MNAKYIIIAPIFQSTAIPIYKNIAIQYRIKIHFSLLIAAKDINLKIVMIVPDAPVPIKNTLT